MTQFFLISPLAPLCLLVGIVFVTIYAMHIAWVIKDRLFNSEASMDAYHIFDMKHEQYPDDRATAERFEFERGHRDSCEMDRLAVVPGDPTGSIIACCTVCFFRVWRDEGASLVHAFQEYRDAA